MYRWVGWFDGECDCEPPEPGKYWLEIQDDDMYEFCVVVYRPKNGSFAEEDPQVRAREERAQLIVDALNEWEAMQ